MNDLLSLDTEDMGQVGAFGLTSALKGHNSKGSGESMLDAESSSTTGEVGCHPSVSVDSPSLTSGATSTQEMMQTSMTTPLIVLTTNASGSVEASVLVDPSTSLTPGGGAPWSSLQLSSLHSLAQANLISDTQQEIAKQLSQRDSSDSSGGSGGGGGGERDRRGEGGGSARRHRKEDGGGGAGDKAGSKLQFANDLRKDLERAGGATAEAGKKQIAIFEAQPSEPKTFVCRVKGCGRKFAWQAHFKYHQLTHTNDRRFVCEEVDCGKKFLTAQRLQVHRRTHTGERPFVCQAKDCGKSFTTAGNLKNHSRVHTGERPFACEVDGCGRRFAEYSSLHKHSLTHSGDKPFICEICGKKFSQSGSRRVHVNRHKLDSAKVTVDAADLDSEVTPDLDDNANMDEGHFKEDLASVNIDEGHFKDMAGVNMDDGHFKDMGGVKVDPDSVLCHQHQDTLHYQDLQNAESVVFPQGLTDHIVTVTTQPPDPETLTMAQDILGAEEVLVEEPMSEEGQVGGGGSVVVLSQPSSSLDSLHHSPLTHHHHPFSSLHTHTHHHHHNHHHNHHKVLTQTVPPIVDYDPHLHHHTITPPSHHHDHHHHDHHHHHHHAPHEHDHEVLSYQSLSSHHQPSHDAQTVAEEIEVSVSSSSTTSHHPQSGDSIHMDPMMESDEEFDSVVGKDIS